MAVTHIESAEAGYAIALDLHTKRVAAGWRPVGRKIGFTNRSIWPRYGVYQPIFGFVYDRTLTMAPDGTATLSLANLAQPRIEPEICFGLKASPPRSKNPAEIVAAIEWVALHRDRAVHAARLANEGRRQYCRQWVAWRAHRWTQNSSERDQGSGELVARTKSRAQE